MQRRYLSILLAALLLMLTLETGGNVALAAEGDPVEPPPIESPAQTPEQTAETPAETPAQTPAETPIQTPGGTPAPEETPAAVTAAKGGIALEARDVTVQQGLQDFDLRSVVTATGNGTPVVELLDDGGFDIETEGTYQVTFRATLGEQVAFAGCTVTVKGPRVTVGTGLTGTSDERYEMFRKYRDSISGNLQQIIAQLDSALAERIALLQSAFPEATNVQLYHVLSAGTDDDDGAANVEQLASIADPKVANFAQILAVFVAKSSLNVNKPLDLYNLRRIRLSGIKDVFWDMLELSYRMEDGTLNILLRERTSAEMAEFYGFTARRKGRLEDLMQPEFQRLFASLTGDLSFADMGESEAAAIRAQLPSGLSMAREKVVVAAHSLVGQIGYFWGGKYPQIGWNPLWGVPKVVTAPGSGTTGTVRSLGLDCSGFVNWVFVNAAGDEAVAPAVGYGSENQWNNSRTLGWDEAQPGDLAFRSIPGTTASNHVGVVVEKRADGTYLVAHCSSSLNTVVITEAWSSGFRYMRRPVLYE